MMLLGVIVMATASAEEPRYLVSVSADAHSVMLDAPIAFINEPTWAPGFQNAAKRPVPFNIWDGYHTAVFLRWLTTDGKEIRLQPQSIVNTGSAYQVTFTDPQIVSGTRGDVCLSRTDNSGTPAYGTDSVICLSNDSTTDPVDFAWGVKPDSAGFRL